MFDLTFDTKPFQHSLDQLGHVRGPRAIARGINRAAATTSTFMGRSVSSDIGLAVGKVRKQMHTDEAKSPSALRARITISGKRIPLIDFSAKGPYPSRGKGRGVTAKLPGGKGRYPHAFIAQMKSGHRGVFERVTRGKGSRRLPIRELRGPSLPHVFTKFISEGLKVAEEAMQKNVAHELMFALKQSST